MPTNGHDSDHGDREERIDALKRRARELAGGQMISGEFDKTPPEVKEGFWNYVVAFEEAPWIIHRKLLERAGISLPAPDTLGDAELSLKLWEVIDHLASTRCFLSETDHLSDRELYTQLLTDALEEETKDMVFDQDSACHIDLCGSGSEEDTFLYLKYYADDEFRDSWRKDYPEAPLPDHEDPPYDRDRFLPAPDCGEPFDPSENEE